MTRSPQPVLVFCALIALSLGGLAGCGDDSTGPSTPPTAADIWLQALADSLANIPDDPSTAQIKSIRYPEIRDGFDAVLDDDPADQVAHLGSGLLDLIELNYDARLWALIDSLEHYDDSNAAAAGGLYLRRGSPILRNQFAILATAPREFMRRAGQGIPANLTVAELQAVIESSVIPALSSAIDHFAAVEAAGGLVVSIREEDETHEIDMGEVWFFHAALHAARAGFRIATAYDVGLPGPDGTYGWVDDMRALDDGCDQMASFEPIGGGSPFYRGITTRYDRSPSDAMADSILISILQHNLNNRKGFLTQRTGGMAAAFSDITTTRSLLASAVASVRAETDDQADDIIRIMDLTDLDSDIAEPDPDRPNFAANFDEIEDVLNWIDEVLSGPYLVSEDGSVGLITFTIDLAGFFGSAPTDWHDLLPYHNFHDPASWVTDELSSSRTDPFTPGVPLVLFDCVAGLVSRDDVAEVVHNNRDVKVDPIQFTDAGGTPIDLDTAKIPHLPDYTLGGLFPDADRNKWLEIHTNAGW